MVQTHLQKSSSSPQSRNSGSSNIQCNEPAPNDYPLVADPDLQHKLSQEPNKSSLKIILKVKVPTTSLESGTFRNSHRKRLPTKKKLQLTDAVNGEAWFPPQNISEGRKSNKPSRRRHTAPGSSVRRKVSTVQRRKRKRDEDTEYRSRTNFRRRMVKNISVDGEPFHDAAFEIFDEEAMKDSNTMHRELTMDDFEAPTPLGFPLRVSRSNDSSAPLQLHTQHDDQLIISPSRYLHNVMSIKTIRNSDLPDTPEFWMDWFMAEQAYKSSDINFKMLCLQMMKLQDQACIPKITVNNPLIRADSVCFFGQLLSQHEKDSSAIDDSRRLRDVMPAYGRECRKDPDDFRILLTYNDWDVLLASVKLARKEMFLNRRQKLKGRCTEANQVVQEVARKLWKGDSMEDEQSHGITIDDSSIATTETVSEIQGRAP